MPKRPRVCDDDDDGPALKKLKTEASDDQKPETIVPQMHYKSEAFINEVLDKTTLRVNNMVLGTKCNTIFERKWLAGKEHGYCNRKLQASTTFSVGTRTGLTPEQEQAMMEGADNTKNPSINMFRNGRLLLTGTPNCESGMKTVYQFVEMLNVMFVPHFIPYPITVSNIKPHNLHVTLSLHRPLNLNSIRDGVACNYDPEKIDHACVKDTRLGITALVYASGHIVLIGAGDISKMWHAACLFARRIAQFCV